MLFSQHLCYLLRIIKANCLKITTKKGLVINDKTFSWVIPWSWRGSNPRPNKESASFLHVYFFVNFRFCNGKEHPIQNLFSKASCLTRNELDTILASMIPLDPAVASQNCRRGTCSAYYYSAGIKLYRSDRLSSKCV